MNSPRILGCHLSLGKWDLRLEVFWFRRSLKQSHLNVKQTLAFTPGRKVSPLKGHRRPQWTFCNYLRKKTVSIFHCCEKKNTMTKGDFQMKKQSPDEESVMREGMIAEAASQFTMFSSVCRKQGTHRKSEDYKPLKLTPWWYTSSIRAATSKGSINPSFPYCSISYGQRGLICDPMGNVAQSTYHIWPLALRIKATSCCKMYLSQF